LTEAELRQISTPQQNTASSSPGHDNVGRKRKDQKEIRKTQASASNLHVVYFWYGTSQTMAFQGLERID
jgi:hypothetical protein